MGEKKEQPYYQVSKTIPSWMLETEEVIYRGCVPSMQAPGIHSSWIDVWNALEGELQSIGTKARTLDQSIQIAPSPMPEPLDKERRKLSFEPFLGDRQVHVVWTGRGLRFLVVPKEFHQMGLIREGWELPVAPWGKPNLGGWTRFMGESQPLNTMDQEAVKAWTWAAMRCKVLLLLIDLPQPEPLEREVPEFLKYLAAVRR